MCSIMFPGAGFVTVKRFLLRRERLWLPIPRCEFEARVLVVSQQESSVALVMLINPLLKKYRSFMHWERGLVKQNYKSSGPDM